ncbi:hypothetical protein DFH09DRAFT_1364989, partial [Mycena vulgaris]
MSSLSTSPTGTITPVPSQSVSPTPTASSTNSNLYLFTFLATLILLLVVSCSIIFRAHIVRRRYRHHVDRAMAQGLILAPPEQGSLKLQFGAEPKLFDVWLTDRKSPLSDSSWAAITPISALPVPAPDGDHFSKWASSVSSKSALTIPSDVHPESLQVSVLVAMPHAPVPDNDQLPQPLPEVALGFTHSLHHD